MQYKIFLANINHEIVLIYHVFFLCVNQESYKAIASANKESATGFIGMLRIWSKAISQDRKGIISFHLYPSKAQINREFSAS